jgi:hypothetical protein
MQSNTHIKPYKFSALLEHQKPTCGLKSKSGNTQKKNNNNNNLVT